MRPSISIRVQVQASGGRRELACVCLSASALLYVFTYNLLLDAVAYIAALNALAYIDSLYVAAYIGDWRPP